MPYVGTLMDGSAMWDLLMEVWRMLLSLIRQEVKRKGSLVFLKRSGRQSSMAGVHQKGSTELGGVVLRALTQQGQCAEHLSQGWSLDPRGKQSTWVLGNLGWPSTPKLKL